MSTITKLTPNHVVINFPDKANDPTAKANSKKLVKDLSNFEEDYTAYCNQSNKPNLATVNSYILQVRAIRFFLKSSPFQPNSLSFSFDFRCCNEMGGK